MMEKPVFHTLKFYLILRKEKKKYTKKAMSKISHFMAIKSFTGFIFIHLQL